MKFMLEINDELEIVKRLTGIKNESRIELNEVGWTSRVYIIDGVDNCVFARHPAQGSHNIRQSNRMTSGTRFA